MKETEIFFAQTIHLILPLIGLLLFLKLAKKMKVENIPNAPTIELFIIFSTYGGLLFVALTALFWLWSGIASLGTFYLILVAPIIMGIITFRHRNTRTISKYHKWTFFSGVLYFAIAPVTFIILFLVTKK